MLAINLTSIGYLSIISENFITRFRMIEYKGAVMRKFVSRDSKKDFYLLYTLVFGVISFFIYYQFAGNGKSLVWSHDGIPQHLNSLAYYGRYLREVLHTIFVEHKLELPMWDMNIGYGSDILTTLQICSITIGAQPDPLTVFASIAMGKIKVFFVKIQIIP